MAAPAHRQGDSQASGSGSRGGSSHHGASVSRKDTSASSTRGEKAKVGNWRIGRTIGKGSSGRVKIAKHAITGKYAAIKIVPKQALVESRMSMSEAGARQDKVLLGIEREIVIMKLIDHPNVLNLYDVWETKTELYLIMEYVPGGELFDYLVKRGRLPVSEALHYFQQIIHAVDYCHRFNICHRDLKPENLLLDKDKNIKVADFGMAAWEAGERMLETSCGSPHYASPEIVAGKAYHGSSSDIWSCGIILFALLTGRLPFDDDNIRSLLQKVKIGVFEMPDEIKGTARDLLQRMLEKDPEKRITMPEILTHPFFVSRSPRSVPGRATVSPPSIDEVERPVNSPEEIDDDIMGNLKTLWSGASDDEIIAALMSKDKTWEKAIYHLLIKYRNKHLENYNMDEEEDAAARARRQARKSAGAPSPAKRKGGTGPMVAKQPGLAPLGENETIQDRAASPSPMSRPQAPTPKKASGGKVEESPISKAKQQPPKSPGGPRPPVSRGNSTASQAPRLEMPGTPGPTITLQEATPTKEVLAANVTARPRSGMSSPGPAESPSLPLNVPQVQDERLQHFFNEVANQLNTMNIRSSVVSTSSNGSGTAILGSDYQAYLAYAAGVNSPIGPLSPTLGHGNGLEVEVDASQFADADDDHSEVASIVSSVQPGRQSPLVGLGLGGPPHGPRPGLHPTQTQNTNRWSYASSTGSSHRGSIYPVESPMQSPALSFGGAQEFIGTTQPLQATRPAPFPPPRGASRLAPTRPAPSAPSATPTSVPSTLESKRTSTLPRDESFVVIDSDTPNDPSLNSWNSRYSANRGQDAFGMLKRRKKNLSNIEPTPFMPSLSGPSSAASTNSSISPKRSWFNNLFSFKPASFTLMSSDNIGNTRERAKKLLSGMGCRVEIVEVDGLRALKCRYDDVKDFNSGTTLTKGVRFRIEFTRSTPMSSGGYNTLVSLTQEKGAQSTFRSIFNQLKASFEGGPSQPSPAGILQSQQRSYDRKPAPQLLSVPSGRQAVSAPNSPSVPQTPRFETGSVHLPSSIRY